MVTLVIIAILASLTLAGLAGTRQRAKIDKTKSTIRKLHEIVMPQYDSYRQLRVSGATALAKLTALRSRIAGDLPDQWDDVQTGAPASAAARRYLSLKTALAGRPLADYFQGAECLALIVLRGGFDSDAVEHFRGDEIGDVDDDGAVEFLDGWGMPIRFIRWPAGYSSLIQPLNAATNPDPLDPMKVSGPTTGDADYGLVPLIYSAGPDGADYRGLLTDSDQPYGITGSGEAVQGGWLAAAPLQTTRLRVGGSNLAGTRGPAAVDNITNHDLTSKR
jgi:hypothetical protein